MFHRKYVVVEWPTYPVVIVAGDSHICRPRAAHDRNHVANHRIYSGKFMTVHEPVSLVIQTKSAIDLEPSQAGSGKHTNNLGAER